MPHYDKTIIQNHLSAASSSATNAAKGKAFEELVCYLFNQVPGVAVFGRNTLNTFLTEEVDIACWNEQHSNGLRSFNAFFLAECKGWTSAVGSDQVNWFLTKIERRGLDFGVLFAMNGITGDAEQLSRAHFEVATALTKKIRMVVIDRMEIDALNSGEELALLIIKKVCSLHASGGRCY